MERLSFARLLEAIKQAVGLGQYVVAEALAQQLTTQSSQPHSTPGTKSALETQTSTETPGASQ